MRQASLIDVRKPCTGRPTDCPRGVRTYDPQPSDGKSREVVVTCACGLVGVLSSNLAFSPSGARTT